MTGFWNAFSTKIIINKKGGFDFLIAKFLILLGLKLQVKYDTKREAIPNDWGCFI